MFSFKALERPFFIAEMSGNHNQSLERALEIVNAAARAKADALKLQTYTPDTMTLNIRNNEFMISDPKSLWFGKSLYELYGEAMTPWEWHEPIKKRCEELGMIFFSTPFDSTAVDFLEELNVPFYKIASFENTDLPLIKKVAQTGKPIIISTGMANQEEVERAVKTARDAGCPEVVLLKCTSSYPAQPKDANLKTIPWLAERFSVVPGLSDHTMGHEVAMAAIALGAKVVEKHFTLRRKDGGVDSAFSLEPEEFLTLVNQGNLIYQTLGNAQLCHSESEKGSLVFRRSIYICNDVKAGDIVTSKNIRIIRPGKGLEPRFYESLIGKKFKRDFKIGEAPRLEDFN